MTAEAVLYDPTTGEVIEVAMTSAEARELTDRIRQTLHVGHDLIVEAFRRSAWSALGYATWDDYCAGEFAGARMVRLPTEQRREIVAEFKSVGMSQRAIASALGVSKNTVTEDVSHIGTPAEPTPISGLDGKTYQPPSPRPQPAEAAPATAPRRKPLTDQARDAGWDLRKSVERLERIAADDRFDTHQEQMAAHLRGHLKNAVEVCQDLLDRLT